MAARGPITYIYPSQLKQNKQSTIPKHACAFILCPASAWPLEKKKPKAGSCGARYKTHARVMYGRAATKEKKGRESTRRAKGTVLFAFRFNTFRYFLFVQVSINPINFNLISFRFVPSSRPFPSSHPTPVVLQ
jgi:hypothetical protein